MANEIEAKIRVESFAQVRKSLSKAGARFLGEAVETDQFFDTPDYRLLKADTGLRLRTTQVTKCGTAAPGCGLPLLTYKGPRLKSKKLKVRREIETNVTDAGKLTAILQAIGFKKSLTVRKRRISYRLGFCRVELDELPGIGRFVEVEGPTGKAVESACRKLNLTGERITESYVSMVAGRVKEGQIPMALP